MSSKPAPSSVAFILKYRSGEVLENLNISQAELETTLFEEMLKDSKNSAQSMLHIQYRMHPAIGELISQCFYDGQLKSGVKDQERPHDLSIVQTPIVWYSTEKLTHHEETSVGHSFQNTKELEIIIDLISRIEAELSVNDKFKKVGVVTGYMPQKHLLRSRIFELRDKFPHLQIEVDTVDGYQGREMDYILYSVVRSNPNRKIGFLRDSRRLNVALSRARELLVIVGDIQTLEFAKTGERDNPFLKVIQYMRRHQDCAVVTL